MLELLGSGGFGTVYRAELLQTDGFTKEVAIKLLHPDIRSKQVLSRFRDEARILGLLQHRSVVQVDALAWLEDRWAVVMEFVDGVSVEDLIQSCQRIPTTVCLEIVEEVAGALYTAWERAEVDGQPLRLLHRDLKPANIQITADGQVKLLDFGIARAEFEGREAETRGQMMGSKPYMSPERFWLEDHHTADVFALAVTACEMLAGSFRDGTSTEEAAHAEWIEARMADVRPLVPEDLAALLTRCLAFEASDRPSAQELASEVRTLRKRIRGPWLRDWAEEVVPPLREQRSGRQDEMSGRIFVEGLSPDATPVPQSRSEPASTFQVSRELMLEALREPKRVTPLVRDNPTPRPAKPAAPKPRSPERPPPRKVVKGSGAGFAIAFVVIGFVIGGFAVVGFFAFCMGLLVAA